MPELAELRKFSEQVNNWSKGRLFSSLLKSQVSKNPEISVPFSLFSVSSTSKGKELCVVLKEERKTEEQLDFKENEQRTLSIIMTMGMSGYWKWVERGAEPKHAHMKFLTDDGKHTLCFVDPRRFGKWSVGSFSTARGPDPTQDFEGFYKNIFSSLNHKDFNKPICEVMLNQKYFNGIGNYLRAEILDRCSIPPFANARKVLSSLSSKYLKSENKEDSTCDIEKIKSESDESEEKTIIQQQTKSEEQLSEVDLITLCRDIPLEVMKIDFNIDDTAEGYHLFENWLQCYSKLKSTRDGTGRTIWYRNQLGGDAPKDKQRKERKKKSSSEAIKRKKTSNRENQKKKTTKRKKRDDDSYGDDTEENSELSCSSPRTAASTEGRKRKTRNSRRTDTDDSLSSSSLYVSSGTSSSSSSVSSCLSITSSVDDLLSTPKRKSRQPKTPSKSASKRDKQIQTEVTPDQDKIQTSTPISRRRRIKSCIN